MAMENKIDLVLERPLHDGLGIQCDAILPLLEGNFAVSDRQKVVVENQDPESAWTSRVKPTKLLCCMLHLAISDEALPLEELFFLVQKATV